MLFAQGERIMRTAVESKMTMHKFTKLVEKNGFVTVYSKDFQLKTDESGTERIFVNSSKGMIIHSTSISGVLDNTRLLFETTEGMNIHRLEIDDFACSDGEHKTIYQISTRVLEEFDKQLAFISKMAKCNSPWKQRPSDYFLFLVNPQEMQYDAFDEGLISSKKVEMSAEPLKRLFGIR